MAISALISEFLESVQSVAHSAVSLRTGDRLIPLHHPFWSPDEIAHGLTIRSDWDVPENLIPFYGDWHELLCIAESSGEVVLMNDERVSLFIWKSGGDFLNCLTTETAEDQSSLPADGSGIIEDKSWLNF